MLYCWFHPKRLAWLNPMLLKDVRLSECCREFRALGICCRALTVTPTRLALLMTGAVHNNVPLASSNVILPAYCAGPVPRPTLTTVAENVRGWP